MPLLIGFGINTTSLYRQALRAADTAYDRTLLASAKSIGEQLQVEGAGDTARVLPTVPYSALRGLRGPQPHVFQGERFPRRDGDGLEDLPLARQAAEQGPYAALVDFYDDTYRGQPVRVVAVLLQPVASHEGRGMTTIQVAETLELRQTLARRSWSTRWRQAALLLVIPRGGSAWVVQRATRPVRC